MFKNYFLLLLLIHILGDFYFQSEKMASSKNNKLSSLLLHGFIFLSTSLIVIIPVYNNCLVLFSIIMSAIHFIIDFIKSLYFHKCKKNNKSYNEIKVYVADQILHIITILTISYLAFIKLGELNLLNCINNIFLTAEVPAVALLKLILTMLIIWKPANITVRILMIPYRPEEGSDEKNNKAGKLIGILERIIICTFLAINQFSAIGLVLTAKSIARYDKISKSQVFAEYYLLGTLISTLIALVTFFIIC